MGIKTFKSTTPGRRQMVSLTYEEITTHNPEKSLIVRLKNNAGRNNQGIITTRHRGGGARRIYRIIDFKQTDKLGIPAVVKQIEYDPNRSAFLMLVHYADGEKRYHIAPQGMKVGDSIMAKAKAKPKTGSRMKLGNIPVGFDIHNLELTPGCGGQMIRSAGSYGKLASLEGEMAHIQMPSGEVRLVDKNCYATIGVVSNLDHANVIHGKAGVRRHMGWRPTVRGKVMNPIDHPHGGGEARNSIGLKHPKTPWGRPALGYKTRNRKKYSNARIVTRRPSRKKSK
jgi:large subunit ribosomal protein L2